jgi:hypothetical protein
MGNTKTRESGVMQLYKLSDNYQRAVIDIEAMFEAGDIDQTTLADTLEGLEGDVKDKAINVALHIKNLRSDLAQLEEAKKSFDARIKQAKSSLEFYEGYLDTNLVKSGITEIKTDTVLIKYKKLPDIVEVAPDAVIPDGFARIIPESREPDKRAILDALKIGATLDFASLITGRTKLEIK